MRIDGLPTPFVEGGSTRRQNTVDRVDRTDGEVEPKTQKDKDLLEACKGFESIFVGFMLKEMRKTAEADSLVPRGAAEDIYTGLLDDEYSRTISGENGLGLADTLYRQLGGSSGDATVTDIDGSMNGGKDA